MLEHFTNYSTSNLQNQFLSGGIVLMVLGTIAAYARRLPSRLYSWLQRASSSRWTLRTKIRRSTGWLVAVDAALLATCAKLVR